MPRTPKPDRPLHVVPGESGWARVHWHPGRDDELVADVRFTVEEPALTLRAIELRISEPSLRRHREFPLSRVENAVNADANVRAEIGMKHAKNAPADLDAYFATKAQIRSERLEPRHRLERPARRRLDDDFYAAVARAYAGAVAEGLNPRKTLADDSGTPADTVARWIAEARKRGHLSAGEPGKASGNTYTKAGHGKVGA
jgi:hypothetical protein